MDSETVIVTPAQLLRYAEFLEDSSKLLRNENRKMRESIDAAKVVWKDTKYDAFHRQLSQSSDDMQKFTSIGLKYAEFLREKARLANKYLSRH